MSKRVTVLKLQEGSPEAAQAIAKGFQKGRNTRAGTTFVKVEATTAPVAPSQAFDMNSMLSALDGIAAPVAVDLPDAQADQLANLLGGLSVGGRRRKRHTKRHTKRRRHTRKH
jgi:hypothetical protein